MTHVSDAWLEICALDDIPIRGARVIKTEGGCIALFRTSDSDVFALDDKCPHKAGPLSQGIVHDSAVTCPLHNWVIDLASGQARGADEGAVKTFKVQVSAGRVLMDKAALRHD